MGAKRRMPVRATTMFDPETGEPPLPSEVVGGKLVIVGEDAGLATRRLDPKHAPAVKRRKRLPAETRIRARELYLEAIEVLGEVATRSAERAQRDKDGAIQIVGPTFAESTAAAAELRKAGYGDRLHLTGEPAGGRGGSQFTVVVLTGDANAASSKRFVEVATQTDAEVE